ncbi:MAG: DUF4258 domain-containing protein [Schwartzia sp.]|nr:DUF4258 domain-containing protein [Schwartzia sp. (in: firmicutes)]
MDEIQARCVAGKIKWSLHASKRMLSRGINRSDVVQCLLHGEIIEEYPEYWLGPAVLVLGRDDGGNAMHVVVGVDDYLHIVTAYQPNSEKFESDGKTRKGQGK